MIELVDARGVTIHLPEAARRIVSLVPSDTLSVCELGGAASLVGRTEYCVEPADVVARLPGVGGTKSVDVAAVIALGPDLVLANMEENTKGVVTALERAGLAVHVGFPRTVREAVEHAATIARALGAPDHPLLRDLRDAVTAHESLRPTRVPVFVPIWWDPLMTFDGRTYASDLLRLAGADNVFRDRPRRYPLAADLGREEARPDEVNGDRDTRYPRTTLDEIESQRPALVLLPDEPYAFGEQEARALSALPCAPKVRFLSGQDLFWFGTHVRAALPRLAAVLSRECDVVS